MDSQRPTAAGYLRIVKQRTGKGMAPGCITAIYEVPAPIVEGVLNRDWNEEEIQEWLETNHL